MARFTRFLINGISRAERQHPRQKQKGDHTGLRGRVRATYAFLATSADVQPTRYGATAKWLSSPEMANPQPAETAAPMSSGQTSDRSHNPAPNTPPANMGTT